MIKLTFDPQEELKDKSDRKSIKYREEGNKYYKNLQIFDAILNYNLAINFATSSESRGLAYGNRSAAYFEAKKYNECIASIKLARECEYPSSKISKLDEREEKCMKLLNSQQDPEDELLSYFKLSYPANEKIPWIIKDLEMKRTKKYGRGIYATRDLKIGDVVCVESSKIFGLQNDDDGFYKHCANCFKINQMCLISCLKTASFMFCSIDCREEFYKHADLSKPKFNKLSVLQSKIEAAFGGKQNLEEFKRQNKAGSTSFFDYDFTDQDNFNLNIYKSFLTCLPSKHLVFGNPKYPTGLFQSILVNNSSVYSHIKPEFIANSKVGRTILKYQDGEIFTSFASLLNNSCVSNLDHFYVSEKVVYVVKRAIKSGEQLTFGYAAEFSEYNKQMRKSILAQRGVFDCGCIACVNNLDINDVIPDNEFTFTMDGEVFRKMIEGTQKQMEKYYRCLEVLKKHTSITSMEYMFARKDAITLLIILAFKAMFPQ